MRLYANKESLQRFRQMGFIFIGLAVFFGGGAYFFPTQPMLYEWLYLNPEEKEAFYMVSLIFLAASVYCLKKGVVA